MKAETISAIITFHSEGLLANKTLFGLERVRKFTELHDLVVEFVIVLDTADEETTQAVNTNPVVRSCDKIIEVENRDLGASRNSGIAVASGTYIGIFDGDDYYSENWLSSAFSVMKKKEGSVIVHPEFTISFGVVHAVGDSLDMDDREDYSLVNFFSINPWTSCSFGKKSTYLSHPYCRTDSKDTGFGYEDWHWNLELVSHGIRHVTAKETALFYRRKAVSMLTGMTASGAVVRPNEFFNRTEKWETGFNEALK
jgi:glycosyltransferase involved in cell wall biosynthesis